MQKRFNFLILSIEKLYLYSCAWNYRPDHCMYMSACDGAKENGIKMLHGCRKAFTTDKQPAFKLVYDVYKDVWMNFDSLFIVLFIRLIFFFFEQNFLV